MSIENALKDFAGSADPGAIVLQGRWGLGKTYFWKRRIIEPLQRDAKTANAIKRYSYVSMFGIENLTDLKANIFQATYEADSAEFLSTRKRFLNLRWWWWKIKQIFPHALESAAIPYVQGLGRTYNALTFFAVRNRLICLDDIERRGSNLQLIDVLGLVAQLAEQRNCRVIVILNTGAFAAEDQVTWDKHKEKVFLGEMTFAPSPEECIDLGLEDAKSERWYPIARERLKHLGVANIRIVHRVKRSIRKAISTVGDAALRDETIDRIARVIVFIEYASSGKGEGAPPLDVVLRAGPFDLALANMRNDEERTPEERKWLEIVSEYNLFFDHELDQSLARMVQNGYPDSAELSEVISSFEAHAQANQEKQAWRDSWALYHDTFAENQDELLDTFERVWPPVSAREHANNLDALVRLMKRLGRPQTASRFIQRWIDERRGDRIEELGPDSYHMFGPLQDPELRDALTAAYARDRPLPDTPTALKEMALNGGMNSNAIAALAAANIDDLVAAIDGNPGHHLSGAISNTLKLGDHPQEPGWAIARENMRGALRKIAERSELQRERVSHKFGVRLDEGENKVDR